MSCRGGVGEVEAAVVATMGWVDAGLDCSSVPVYFTCAGLKYDEIATFRGGLAGRRRQSLVTRGWHSCRLSPRWFLGGSDSACCTPLSSCEARSERASRSDGVIRIVQGETIFIANVEQFPLA